MTTTTQMPWAACRSGGNRWACGEITGHLTEPDARSILGIEHSPGCGQWLAAVAYLSAGLDDD
ncbi:hypothetical protein [Nocardia sp. alder85J]|uniref:hypothetical protein n=1 Tax=Nocardia sp. alder85J TaxID=2862949 RepID=UPI001CD1C464|nr:hypothetical protein [Nocardia sp. alder85J]MCX4094921.1 hypothetical protein [Nocardia sp. alder85J]